MPSTALQRGSLSLTSRMGFLLNPKITSHSLAKLSGLLKIASFETNSDTGPDSPVLRMAGAQCWIKRKRYYEGFHIKTLLEMGSLGQSMPEWDRVHTTLGLIGARW